MSALETKGGAPNTRNLDALFGPRSIAIIGASSDPSRIGGRPVRLLQQYGFAGAIYPINAKNSEVQGLPAFPNIDALPAVPDLVVLSIPMNGVIAQLEACAARGVKAAIVFSSGFAEAGEAGKEEQDKIHALAQHSNLRVLGPNCLGMMSIENRVICTFGAAPNFGLPESGGLSIVSQSGAFGTYTFMTGKLRGLPVSRWVTTGNEGDIDFADCVAWLVRDEQTKVIMGYMEGTRDGVKLQRALEMAHDAGKPVVVMKVGHTEAGSAAAKSHTAALAGSDALFDTLFRRCGAHRAATVDEFFDVGYVCLRGLLPRSPRLGIITGSGGAGVLMADAAESNGLDVEALPDEAQSTLRELVPFAGTRNPVDVTGQVTNDRTLFTRFLDVMVREGKYHAIAAFQALAGLDPAAGQRTVELWRGIRAKYPDMPLFVTMLSRPEIRRAMEELHIPVFDEPTRMIGAIGALVELRRERKFRKPSPARLPRLSPGGLDEVEAANVLREAGIPMVDYKIAQTADEAVAAARQFGFPVILKIVSPDIAHKSDVGGVALNLASDDAVRDAMRNILRNVREARPEAKLRGVAISPMVRGGVEMIAGVRDDAIFGPVVMVGGGGTAVEAFNDVAFRLPPFDRSEALDMIGELRSAALLRGIRGRGPCDISALADVLVALGDLGLVNAGAFDTIEINPVLVLPQGQGAIGLDALIC